MTKPAAMLICPIVPLRQIPDAEKDVIRRPNRFQVKHGCATPGKQTRTYKIWGGMRARCNIPSAAGYERYGGIGIKVCERWDDFSNFLADMGEAPEGMSIDRENSAGDYEPGNCRWATRQTQNENRKSVRWYELDGVRLTAAGWSKRLGINKSSMYERLEKWPLRQALGAEPRPPQVHVPPKITPEIRKKMSDAAKARCARNGGRVIP